MPHLSHDILVPDRTVSLSPLAVYREPGHIGDSPKSAIRALQILELLAASDTPLRAIRIAGPLGISPSSANQLLKAMVDWGYLIFDPVAKLYAASPRMAKIADPVSGEYFGPGALDGLMRSVRELFDGWIYLSASQGAYMQIVDALPPSGEPLESPVVGFQVALFGTCTGAAWLSSQSAERIAASIRLCRRDLGRQADDAEALVARMHALREQGYAFGGMSSDDRSRGIGITLPPTRNGIVLVLTMYGARAAMEARRDALARQAQVLIRQHLPA